YFSEVEVAQAPALNPLPEFFSFEERDGKSYLQYQGWMLEAERDQLVAAYAGSRPDQEAARQLYDASQRKMIQYRDIRIRCSRGAPAPSDMLPFSFMK